MSLVVGERFDAIRLLDQWSSRTIDVWQRKLQTETHDFLARVRDDAGGVRGLRFSNWSAAKDARLFDLLAAWVRNTDSERSIGDRQLRVATALFLGKYGDGWQDLERIYTPEERTRDVRFDCHVGRLGAAGLR